jgi:hypothetical protein
MVSEVLHEYAASLPAAVSQNQSRRGLIKCAKDSGHYQWQIDPIENLVLRSVNEIGPMQILFRNFRNRQWPINIKRTVVMTNAGRCLWCVRF